MKQPITKPDRDIIFTIIVLAFAIFALRMTYKMITKEPDLVNDYQTRIKYEDPHSDTYYD